MTAHRIACATALVAMFSISGAFAQQVTKEAVPGVTNFARLDTTIACAGATTPAAIAEVKKLGYRSVVNLRPSTENGADIPGEMAAAKAAGIPFFDLPFNAAAPDSEIVERFLTVVSAAENQPAFVHCASGNRAAALWMIKRMVVDGWDGERAGAEASALGLTNPALKTFALDYAAKRKK